MSESERTPEDELSLSEQKIRRRLQRAEEELTEETLKQDSIKEGVDCQVVKEKVDEALIKSEEREDFKDGFIQRNEFERFMKRFDAFESLVKTFIANRSDSDLRTVPNLAKGNRYPFGLDFNDLAKRLDEESEFERRAAMAAYADIPDELFQQLEDALERTSEALYNEDASPFRASDLYQGLDSSIRGLELQLSKLREIKEATNEADFLEAERKERDERKKVSEAVESLKEEASKQGLKLAISVDEKEEALAISKSEEAPQEDSAEKPPIRKLSRD